jgi:hypothetical protein
MNPCPLKLSGKRPGVDVERSGDGLERATRFVVLRCLADDAVGHLANRAPCLDPAAVEVVHDRRPVCGELRGEYIDRRARQVVPHEMVDLVLVQPPLYRV